jgi:hypothetical protein
VKFEKASYIFAERGIVYTFALQADLQARDLAGCEPGDVQLEWWRCRNQIGHSNSLAIELARPERSDCDKFASSGVTLEGSCSRCATTARQRTQAFPGDSEWGA